MHTERRPLLRAGVGLAILIVIAGLAWFVWIPNYRPGLHDGERYGIDVSHHQGDIDWDAVANDDISFAYIKASEGSDFVDPRFSENWRGSGRAGLDRGAYHFFSLCVPGEDQARHFSATVPPSFELPPAVDLELTSVCRARPDSETVRRQLEDFLIEVETHLGVGPVLYVGRDFAMQYPDLALRDHRRWRLRFLLRPAEGWFLWQVGSVFHVDGVEGPVGLDVMRTT